MRKEFESKEHGGWGGEGGVEVVREMANEYPRRGLPGR